LESLTPKLEALKSYIAKKGQGGVVIAFSGGVDSSTLAAVCHKVLADKAVAVIATSPTYTSQELQEAKQTATDIGIQLYTLQTNELDNPDFARNPENRCYFCKKELLQTIVGFAYKNGFQSVFEGTNFSDLNDHRPGFKAIQETPHVYSPWMIHGFTKDEIRQVAKQMGLSAHDKPALACLASRIAFNEKITVEKLHRIERAEQAIKKIVTVKQLRVRDHNGLARIEVSKTERHLFFKTDVLDKIAEALKELGFKYVTFDLEGFRSGSMLKTIEKT
jgi:uncharacterized protein